ncbi:MAG TPA: response regulator [Thermoanaerobaculia bacterium]|nr:response regulator [Thermoanaerobaculia bacterium]
MLIVDDDYEVRGFLSIAFERAGIDVDVAENGTSAIQLIDRFPSPYCAVVLDLHIPAPDGITVAQHIQECCEGLPIVILTGRSDLVERVKEMNLTNVRAILVKPVQPSVILTAAHSACTRGFLRPND